MDQPHSDKPNTGKGAATPEPGRTTPWAAPGESSPAPAQAWPTTTAPGGPATEQVPPAPAAAAPEQDAEVMTKLPRSRPQRRSARRPASGRVARKATPARKTTARARTSSNSGRSRSTKRPVATAQPATGLPERAIGIAVAPLKLTATLTRGTARLIGRNIPRP